MLINDTTKDFKKLLIDVGMNQTSLAEKVGTSKQYVNRLLNADKDVVNGMFLKLVEAMGYDIEIHYVKRGDEK